MTESPLRSGQDLIVQKAYQSEFPDPIRVARGEQLLIGDMETVFPGWLWVTIPDGRSGWIPSSFVSQSGDRGSALRDYDATELTVKTGDRLKLIECEGSWVRVETTDGRVGWVPEENVSPSD